jgi:hypothetical protein
MESTATLNEAAYSNTHEGESKKDKALGRIGCTGRAGMEILFEY